MLQEALTEPVRPGEGEGASIRARGDGLWVGEAPSGPRLGDGRVSIEALLSNAGGLAFPLRMSGMEDSPAHQAGFPSGLNR